MKRVILILVASLSVTFYSCNSDDSNESVNLTPQEQQLLGAWEVTSYGHINANGSETVQPFNSECLNTYTFTSNKQVNYKTYFTCSDMDEENGTWSIQNDVLTRVFPQDVTVTMEHNIQFVTDSKIKLFELDDSTNFVLYEKIN